jgi:hypothetical protein
MVGRYNYDGMNTSLTIVINKIMNVYLDAIKLRIECIVLAGSCEFSMIFIPR